jgi:hypothetical protein
MKNRYGFIAHALVLLVWGGSIVAVPKDVRSPRDLTQSFKNYANGNPDKVAAFINEEFADRGYGSMLKSGLFANIQQIATVRNLGLGLAAELADARTEEDYDFFDASVKALLNYSARHAQSSGKSMAAWYTNIKDVALPTAQIAGKMSAGMNVTKAEETRVVKNLENTENKALAQGQDLAKAAATKTAELENFNAQLKTKEDALKAKQVEVDAFSYTQRYFTNRGEYNAALADLDKLQKEVCVLKQKVEENAVKAVEAASKALQAAGTVAAAQGSKPEVKQGIISGRMKKGATVVATGAGLAIVGSWAFSGESMWTTVTGLASGFAGMVSEVPGAVLSVMPSLDTTNKKLAAGLTVASALLGVGYYFMSSSTKPTKEEADKAAAETKAKIDAALQSKNNDAAKLKDQGARLKAASASLVDLKNQHKALIRAVKDLREKQGATEKDAEVTAKLAQIEQLEKDMEVKAKEVKSLDTSWTTTATRIAAAAGVTLGLGVATYLYYNGTPAGDVAGADAIIDPKALSTGPSLTKNTPGAVKAALEGAWRFVRRAPAAPAAQ